MATFLEMQNDVYSVLRDSDRQFVVVTDVKRWINQAYLDIVARLSLLVKKIDSATSSTGEVALPSDFIKLEQFSVDNPLTSLREDPVFVEDDIYLWYVNHDVETDEIIYRIYAGSTIQTWPVVEEQPYTMEFVYKPVPLSDDADVPLIPEELHTRLTNFARFHAKLKEGETDEAGTYYSLWEDGLPPTQPTATTRKRPGPIRMAPELTYWDTEL